MNGKVSRKETGTKFRARSNSSVAVLQADKSLLKIKGTVLSRHLKLFEGNFGSTEMKSDPRFPFASSFYIVHFSREWNEKRFVIGHCVPMLRGLFRDEGENAVRNESSFRIVKL